MTTAQRTYRGIAYNPSEHECASNKFMDHIYRGNHYQAPLKHDPSQANEKVELHYRGSVYHHRQKVASTPTES